MPEHLAQVRVELIENRSGQILRNYLLDELTPLGQPARSAYSLQIRLVEPRTNLIISRSDTTLRYGYSAIASFRLVDAAGKLLYSGSASSTTSFDASDSEFATLASQADARNRILLELSGDIRNQLALYFRGQNPPPLASGGTGASKPAR